MGEPGGKERNRNLSFFPLFPWHIVLQRTIRPRIAVFGKFLNEFFPTFLSSPIPCRRRASSRHEGERSSRLHTRPPLVGRCVYQGRGHRPEPTTIAVSGLAATRNGWAQLAVRPVPPGLRSSGCRSSAPGPRLSICPVISDGSRPLAGREPSGLHLDGERLADTAVASILDRHGDDGGPMLARGMGADHPRLPPLQQWEAAEWGPFPGRWS